MWLQTSLAAFLPAISFLLCPAFSQTYTNCNPLQGTGCPPDSALGRAVNIDFTQGPSDSFTPQGNPSYGSDGASFTVAGSGDSPQLTSKWYIMFGRVEVVLKAAPGAGIVSSFVLQSDDLDEIDWEWLGADNGQVQSNYFGKGITGSYNRGAWHPNPNNQDKFHKYTIDWTANQVVWQIDDKTIRALNAESAGNEYPQTPMQVKIGAWSGGDSGNPQGTIEWARGPTDYSQGPFSMLVKSVAVTDYSTGKQYVYTTTSGRWQDIEAVGGSVNPSGNGAPSPVGDAPAVTSLSTGGPIPFQGARGSPAASYPTGYPWVPMSTFSTVYSNYPGLPSGWSVTSTGKVVPPNAASTRHAVSQIIVVLAATVIGASLVLAGRL